jgi:frataxin
MLLYPARMAEELSQSGFEALADQALSKVFDAIEDAATEQAQVDIEGSVLTLEIDGVGTYVLNKHVAMKQLWLSSPQSGAHHYAWDGKLWVSTRGGPDLMSLLSGELGRALGQPVTLE